MAGDPVSAKSIFKEETPFNAKHGSLFQQMGPEHFSKETGKRFLEIPSAVVQHVVEPG